MATRQRHEKLIERREATQSAANTSYIKNECRNTPLGGNEVVEARQLRTRLAWSAFNTGDPPVYGIRLRPTEDTRAEDIYLGPPDAYSVAFLAQLDIGVIELVKRTFADERAAIMRGQRLPVDARHPRLIKRQQPDEPGVVYCFWNILDLPELKKIGRTRRRAEERGREWEATLTPEAGQQIVMLFSVPTRHNVFAERVVHATLLCEHQGGRVNELTGQLLTEYYRVTDFMALKLFIMMCVGYIDQWYDTVEAEFRTGSQLYSQWQTAISGIT